MTDERDMCRRAASECIELAKVTRDPARKEALLLRAQDWLKLAYAHSEEDFERLVRLFNAGQFVQRQPMQQQQSRPKSE